MFFYLVEKCEAVPSRECLVERGLLPVVGGRWHAREVRVDAVGAAGVLVLGEPYGAGALASVRVEELRWAARGNGVWVGFARLPGEEELRRDGADGWPGVWCVMGNGERWRVPVLRSLGSGVRLPASMVEREGRWERETQVRYLSLERLVARGWIDAVCAMTELPAPEDHRGLDLDEQSRLVSEALGVCYRVGPVEVGLLGLLTTGEPGGSLLHALGISLGVKGL